MSLDEREIYVLKRLTSGSSLQEVADAIGVTAAYVWKIADILTEENYLMPSNRKARSRKLTPSGEILLKSQGLL